MNYRYIKSMWGKVCPLDRALWGNYHKPLKRTPLCIMPHCYKYSVYRYTETGCVENLCEYHAGQIGAMRHAIIEKAIEQRERWQAEQGEDYEI